MIQGTQRSARAARGSAASAAPEDENEHEQEPSQPLSTPRTSQETPQFAIDYSQGGHYTTIDYPTTGYSPSISGTPIGYPATGYSTATTYAAGTTTSITPGWQQTHIRTRDPYTENEEFDPREFFLALCLAEPLAKLTDYKVHDARAFKWGRVSTCLFTISGGG
jgi:hypothetical protein